MRQQAYRAVMIRNGNLIGELAYYSIAWQTILSASGWFEIVMPWQSMLRRYVKRDNIISIFRHGRHQITGFVETIDETLDLDDRMLLVVTGRDLNSLLDHRIAPFAPRTADAHEIDEPGNIAKAIVRNNFVAPATASRRVPASFSVENDKAEGQTITYEFPFMNVEQACQELMEIAHATGTRLYYNVAYLGYNNYQFRTYINGIYDLSSRVMFSAAYHNLETPSHVRDYSRDRNVVYYSYRGSDDATIFDYVEDTSRSKASLWSRREAYVNAGNQILRSAEGMAETKLRNTRPRDNFSARLIPSGMAFYDSDWRLGTRCKVHLADGIYTGVVRSVRGEVNADQQERIVGLMEIEDVP